MVFLGLVKNCLVPFILSQKQIEKALWCGFFGFGKNCFLSFILSQKQITDFGFSSMHIKKVSNCDVKTQKLNCLCKFHRFLWAPIPKIKICHRSLYFIHVYSVLLHRKTQHLQFILPVVVFSPPLDNICLELYYPWRKI